MILLLVGGAWWRATVFGVLLAGSLWQSGSLVLSQQAARGFAGAAEATPLLKLVSFNTLQSNDGNGRRIADYLIGSGADVIMLMEAGPVGPYAKDISAIYPYNSGCAPSGSPCR